MIDTIIKRTGKKQKFNKEKINDAIYKAIINTRIKLDLDRARELSSLATEVVVFKINELGGKVVHLEELQDIVEETLMNLGMTDVSRSYIRYRFQREILRSDKETALSVEKMMGDYLNEKDWLVKENANMDYSLQGLHNYLFNEITKNFWLNHVYTDEQKKAHVNGDIHIHDLGFLATYCCGWDLEAILLEGFRGVKNKAAARPPKHLKAALGQLVNFLYTLQGESAGAQAVSSIDTYMAPFIRYDKLNYKQVKQTMQEFIFNLSVPTRVGFQTPFVNFTFDVVVSPILKDNHVIIGGVPQEETYKDFQEEMDMFNKAFCEIMSEGDASGRLFTFPIPTYNITKDFDWDSPVVNEIMKMTNKYGIPYFANFINSDMKPEDARSMCCRLRLDNRELRKRGGGLFGANPLTGSIGIVTVNLPRLGYLYKDEKELKKNLKHILVLCKNTLEIKRKVLEKNTITGLYPYSRYYLRVVFERFGEYWKNHFNTIGIIGMNELIKNFTNNEDDITTEKGQELAKNLMDYMNEIIKDFQKDGDLYNLEATPGEGTTYRLAKLDKEIYPDIITAGTNEPYYTNSTQVPVNYTTDLFEVLRLQDDLQSKYTGGTVLHAYLGERLTDVNITKNLIKKVFENYNLPYFSLTPTFSICDEHGYLDGEQFICPKCGKDTEVWTRVVGYYRPVQAFNKGKFEEFSERIEYKVD